MVTVGMNYMVLPGKEQFFENAFRGVVEAMSAEAAHVRTGLYRSVGEDGAYLVMSEWSSREAFQGFVRSPRFAAVVAWGKEQILRAPPKHQIFEG